MSREIERNLSENCRLRDIEGEVPCYVHLAEQYEKHQERIEDVTRRLEELHQDFREAMLGRSPKGYVPITIYFITIIVALGLSDKTKILEGIEALWKVFMNTWFMG